MRTIAKDQQLLSSRVVILLLIAALLAEAAPPQQLDQIKGRIITGTDASVGQFPWQVILKRDEWDDLLCGGSIISDSWVLTAGHCAYGRDSLYLVFGTIELNDESAQSMTSTKLYVHPNYNDKMNNDVALVQLPQPLTFTNNIQPITLVSSTQSVNTYVGTEATIAGFGLVDDEYLDYSQVLQYAQVQVIANDKCSAVFGTSVVLSSTMCAQGNAGSNMSTCSGDSGGPLIINNNGAWLQIGINSFVAEDRCTTGLPSGYVRLTSFIDYIAETTGLALS
ncbi:brachyurin [Drosophila sulfurigaster albostrigata]|uniref:brachyurin n=1 Tax=Drosophila sulfurigaster albostrigata TaxID=89887 RepID=UPI002D21ADA9|nr:brachyurin [Drosophila sulfurigaster albostrigata]